MSSLLDVLHKRPTRSQAAAQDEAGAFPVESPSPSPEDPVVDPQTLELRLAPEHDPAHGTLTLRRPALPAGDDATPRTPAPQPAPSAPAETAQVRRWSDPAPPQAASPRPASPAPAAGSRHADRSRKPFVLAIAVAAAAALGYATYQFTGPADDSFLATPAAQPPPAQVEPAAAPREAAPGAEAPKPRKKSRPAAAQEDSAGAGGDLAWYDQPALPAATPAAEAPVIQITRGTAENPLFGKLHEAWTAMQAGDAARAEPLYREVLAADPASIDALLGLAALAGRGGRFDEARDLYRRVRLLDPRNGTAAAALSAMPGEGARPAAESELKGMLRDQPESAALHFALGLRYVADQRWPDAQVAFFDAVRYDPTNADYAFNLAVSLDRLGQAGPAASYYQRSIDLASGSHQFAVETARARLATLRGPPG